MIHAPNRNYVWTYTFVQALAEAGLRNVVIAPGSRSTPLTMAFARHPDIRVYSHIDERGAAFMALGLALAQDAPSAVVCSSGTAAANFYPAIVEAHYAHVPLLVLTADRPHELRDSGANQTVDQVKLYGDHVLWSVDVALPEANPPDVALRNLRSLAARAYALADGMPKGAVHLNFPFRKPLEPTEVAGEGRELVWGVGLPREDAKEAEGDFQHEGMEGTEAHGGRVGTPFMASADGYRAAPRIERGVPMPSTWQVKELAWLIKKAKRGLIVCGPRPYADHSLPDKLQDFGFSVLSLSASTGLPVMSDPLAGMRFGANAETGFSFYDTFLRIGRFEPPDFILHFGAMPISQALLDYLATPGGAKVVWVSADGGWSDADHVTDLVIHADPGSVCEEVAKHFPNRDEIPESQHAYRSSLGAAEVATRDILAANDSFFDGLAVYNVIRATWSRQDVSLFVANSLPIRHLDQFGGINKFPVNVFCNRGASGIDGTISSALGVSAADPDKPTVLIIGDLALYHDMNALLAAKRNGINNLVIVLLNNNGGQIFRRLPINQPEFEPEFTELFITPHGMTFEHTAAQFGFAYARADEREGFRTAFAAALVSGVPGIVEVVTDAEEDAKRRKALMDKVAEAIRGLGDKETP